VHITNGTSGGPGTAESVTLYRLSEEMTPVEELRDVSGSFDIEGIEVEGERPMLLQVTSAGVNYNQPVLFGRGYEAQVEVTVYDVFAEWSDEVLEVATSRFLVRRMGDTLRVDKVFVIENRSSPPRVFHSDGGTFRFFLPTVGLKELLSISATTSLGMPVPQQAAPLPDGTGYFTRTAFKPGETDLTISYEVSYEGGRHELLGRVYHPLSELLVLLAPADVQADTAADGWEYLGPEPQGRFAAVRKVNLAPGTSYRLPLSGGSEMAGDLVSSGSTGSGGGTPGGSTAGAAASAPHGPVTRIPDTTLSSKWIVVMLMAAALAYGLLATLFSPPRR
jgi:hypothetical protein